MNNANIRTTNKNVHETLDQQISEIESRELDTIDILKNIRIKNKKGLVIAYLNIDSIRNKIEPLKLMVSKYVDILTIAETKIDETFTTSQFMIEGIEEPFRKDRNKNGGGLLTYAREGIYIKELKNYKFPNDIEICATEIKLRTKKLLLLSIYRPPSQCPSYFFEEIEKGINFFSNKFENLIVMGDFNCEVGDSAIKAFMDTYTLVNLIKNPTCHKSDSPPCIDLILTNCKSHFQNTTNVETGLSDFHVMILSILKGDFIKRGPKIITYRDYKQFDIPSFRSEISNPQILNCRDYGNIDILVKSLLNKYAPIKRKYVRANDGPFTTKELRKAIMHRSKLKNTYNKNKNDESHKAYKRQRNRCVKLLRNAKNSYFRNIDLSNLTDNRKFWKAIKPVFADKIQTAPSITLEENGELISDDRKIAELCNNYFLNITQDLGIQEDFAHISITNGVSDPIDKAIEKYKNHPSILKIKEMYPNPQPFEFREVDSREIWDQINKLNTRKAAPIESVPAKIFKEYADIFSEILQRTFNEDLANTKFPEELKLGDISSLHKKDDKFNKKIINLSLSYHQRQKYMRELWNHKLHPLLKTFYHQCYVVSEGITVPNIFYSDL